MLSQRPFSWGEDGLMQTGGGKKEQVTTMKEKQMEVGTGPSLP